MADAFLAFGAFVLGGVAGGGAAVAVFAVGHLKRCCARICR